MLNLAEIIPAYASGALFGAGPALFSTDRAPFGGYRADGGTCAVDVEWQRCGAVENSREEAAADELQERLDTVSEPLLDPRNDNAHIRSQLVEIRRDVHSFVPADADLGGPLRNEDYIPNELLVTLLAEDLSARRHDSVSNPFLSNRLDAFTAGDRNFFCFSHGRLADAVGVVRAPALDEGSFQSHIRTAGISFDLSLGESALQVVASYPDGAEAPCIAARSLYHCTLLALSDPLEEGAKLRLAGRLSFGSRVGDVCWNPLWGGEVAACCEDEAVVLFDLVTSRRTQLVPPAPDWPGPPLDSSDCLRRLAWGCAERSRASPAIHFLSLYADFNSAGGRERGPAARLVDLAAAGTGFADAWESSTEGTRPAPDRLLALCRHPSPALQHLFALATARTLFLVDARSARAPLAAWPRSGPPSPSLGIALECVDARAGRHALVCWSAAGEVSVHDIAQPPARRGEGTSVWADPREPRPEHAALADAFYSTAPIPPLLASFLPRRPPLAEGGPWLLPWRPREGAGYTQQLQPRFFGPDVKNVDPTAPREFSSSRPEDGVTWRGAGHSLAPTLAGCRVRFGAGRPFAAFLSSTGHLCLQPVALEAAAAQPAPAAAHEETIVWGADEALRASRDVRRFQRRNVDALRKYAAARATPESVVAARYRMAAAATRPARRGPRSRTKAAAEAPGAAEGPEEAEGGPGGW
eukprot:tig00001130_g7246.t1